MKAVFLFFTVFILGVSPTEADEDIIESVVAHPIRQERLQQPNGSYKDSQYGDQSLADAVTFLSGRYPRPWTVAKVLVWTREARDDHLRARLIRLLAASRDPRAALVLGDLFASRPSAALDAGYGLLDYFLPIESQNGGTEQHMKAVEDWLTTNKERIRKEAATK